MATEAEADALQAKGAADKTLSELREDTETASQQHLEPTRPPPLFYYQGLETPI